jgi:hypothetical protein
MRYLPAVRGLGAEAGSSVCAEDDSVVLRVAEPAGEQGNTRRKVALVRVTQHSYTHQARYVQACKRQFVHACI